MPPRPLPATNGVVPHPNHNTLTLYGEGASLKRPRYDFCPTNNINVDHFSFLPKNSSILERDGNHRKCPFCNCVKNWFRNMIEKIPQKKTRKFYILKKRKVFVCVKSCPMDALSCPVLAGLTKLKTIYQKIPNKSR